MRDTIMVGCDLHDKTMVLKIAQGRDAARSVTRPNTREGRTEMIGELQAMSRQAGGAAVMFAYEASGQGFGLHDDLTAAGIDCRVLAPTKIVRSLQQQRLKTDEKDAAQILEILRAHVLAGSALPSVWVPDPQLRDDRELVRARLDIAEKAAAIKTQIRCLLKRELSASRKRAGELDPRLSRLAHAACAR